MSVTENKTKQARNGFEEGFVAVLKDREIQHPPERETHNSRIVLHDIAAAKDLRESPLHATVQDVQVRRDAVEGQRPHSAPDLRT